MKKQLTEMPVMMPLYALCNAFTDVTLIKKLTVF